MRLIDADALPIQNVAVRGSGKSYYDVAMAWLIAIVDAAPTIEAEPVRHGRWIKEELVGCEPYYLCSMCGKLHYHDYNFCNNCGCKMDGGAEE